MLSLYLLALAFGGVLLGVSLVMGGDHDKDLGHDHEVGHDVDHDAGHDVDHDADDHVDHGSDHAHGHAGAGSALAHSFGDLWRPVLSIRFATFFAFTFGLAGTLLTLLGVPTVLGAVFAVLPGLVLGWIAARFFRALTRDEVTADVGLQSLVGEEARVVLTVRPGSIGRILVDTPTGRLELSATTHDEDEIVRGEHVLIASVGGEAVDVTRLPSAGRPGEGASERRAGRAASWETAR
jgi:membrane protein implicated in regulation of membrane protease activity